MQFLLSLMAALAAQAFGAAVIPANQVPGVISIADLPKDAVVYSLDKRASFAAVEHVPYANAVVKKDDGPVHLNPTDEDPIDDNDDVHLAVEGKKPPPKCLQYWCGAVFCYPKCQKPPHIPEEHNRVELLRRTESEAFDYQHQYYPVGHTVPYPLDVAKDQAAGKDVIVYVNDEGQPAMGATSKKCCRWIGSRFCRMEPCKDSNGGTATDEEIHPGSGDIDRMPCCYWIIDLESGEATQFCIPGCKGTLNEPVVGEDDGGAKDLEYWPTGSTNKQCCQWVIAHPWGKVCLPYECKAKRTVDVLTEDDKPIDDKTVNEASDSSTARVCPCITKCKPWGCQCVPIPTKNCPNKRDEDVSKDIKPIEEKPVDNKDSGEVTDEDESPEVVSDMEICPCKWLPGRFPICIRPNKCPKKRDEDAVEGRRCTDKKKCPCGWNPGFPPQCLS